MYATGEGKNTKKTGKNSIYKKQSQFIVSTVNYPFSKTVQSKLHLQ